eukprot:3634196-Alexandrium_andersonii.AAC.1
MVSGPLPGSPELPGALSRTFKTSSEAPKGPAKLVRRGSPLSVLQGGIPQRRSHGPNRSGRTRKAPAAPRKARCPGQE